MKKQLVLISFALFAQACMQSAPTSDSSLGGPSSEKWELLLNKADIEGLLNLYTKDVRLMPPNGQMKTGHDAVREEFGSMIEAGMTMDLTSIDSNAVADTAYNVGTYVLSIGDEIIDNGKWIETWERQDDGAWRISNDIWNSDNPPPPAAKKPMTHMMGIHKVGNAEVWLAAWRGENSRHKDFAAHGAPHVHVMQSPDDPNLTGLIIGLEDAEAFDAWLKSDAGKAAATADTVDLDSITLLMEVD